MHAAIAGGTGHVGTCLVPRSVGLGLVISVFAFGVFTPSIMGASLAISGSDSEVVRTTITADPSGQHVFVMWTTRDCFPLQAQSGLHLRFNSSSSGGAEWMNGPVDFKYNSHVTYGDVTPELAIDTQRKLHVIWSCVTDRRPPWYTSSPDLGRSWSDRQPIEGHGWVQGNGLGLAVSEDGKNLWAFYNNADWDADDCRSGDGGLTWQRLGYHTGNSGNPNRSYCSDAIVAGDVRYVLRKRNDQLDVMAWDDRKWAASTPTQVEGALSLADDHTMVTDPTGYLSIVFSDAGRVYCMGSEDHGGTWKDKIRVDDSPGGQQLLPVIGMTADGSLVVAWQDGREANSRIRYAISKNAGGSWSASNVLAPAAKSQTAPDMYVVGQTLYFSYTESRRAVFARIPDVAPLDTSNLLPNPGFDVFDGRLPAGWTFDSWKKEYAKEQYGQVSPGPNGEGFCLELQQGSPAGAFTIRSQPVQATAETTYVFKGYYAAGCEGKTLVVGKWLDKAGKGVGSFEFKLPDTQKDWIEFFKAVISPVDTTQLEISITKQWQDGFVRFDDFSLREGCLRDYESEFSLPPLEPGRLRFPVYPGMAGRMEPDWEAECAVANFSVACWQAKYGLQRRMPAAWGPTDAELIKANEDPDVFDIAGHDEPGKWQYLDFAEKNRRFKRLAPSRPFVVNLLPCYGPYSPYPVYRDYVRSYIETVKPTLFTYDHYALGGKSPHHGGAFFANFEIAREEAVRANIHFGFFGSVGHFGGMRSASEAELHWQAYSALAYGARLLAWFLYSTPPAGDYGPEGAPGDWRDHVIDRDGSRTRHYAMFRRLNGEILALGDTLLRLESTGVFHTRPLPELTKDIARSTLIRSVGDGQWIAGEFVDGSDRPCFMLVNRDFTKQQEAVINFRGKVRKLFEVSKIDGQKAPVKAFDVQSGTVRLNLSAGDGRLFIVE